MTRMGCFQRRHDESSATNRADSTATATECPECGGELVTADAERVCDDCGLLVAAEEIDRGPEWWSAGDQDSMKRTGPSTTPARHDRGLTTSIGWSVDGQGNTLSGPQRQRAARLRRSHTQTACQSTAERNERYGLGEVRRMASALGLGSWLRNQACRLFSTAQNAGLLIGRSVECIAAGSLYAACRCVGRPLPLGEVAQVARVPESKVALGYRILNRELELPAEPVSPVQLLPRFVSELGLTSVVEQRAWALLNDVEPSVVCGAKPAGVAGGAILAALKEDPDKPIYQADVADVAGVSVPTLRRYRDELMA